MSNSAEASSPLISVVTATYDLLSQGRQAGFERAMACMARQNCAEAEHIIQDGASTDGTVAFVQELINQAPNARLISEPDTGLYDAMNKGVAAARGEYVLFLNSDDALASDDVLNMAADRLRATRPAFLYGSTVQKFQSGETRKEKRMSVTAILQRMPFCHNSVFLRRDVFLALGGHDTNFRIAADYDLMLRLIASGYQGERMDDAVSLFWDRGVTQDDAETGLDYARVWLKFYDGFKSARNLTLEDFAEFYRRGHMPARLLLELLRRPDTPEPIKIAARHCLAKTLRRSLQVWRKY
ncbi:glycosyltransferase family 2 protein [Ruegeria sp. HKCCD7255]|uniref:glycosyltransferase family 2 protein n=1 Tax=Ruegeria sp. HKCCD7255 TaxID=2683004 RepID=UPI001488978B|nr:glycosyltransferase family 2 protein [Ruegeria sp. HKCCD7255]